MPAIGSKSLVRAEHQMKVLYFMVVQVRPATVPVIARELSRGNDRGSVDESNLRRAGQAQEQGEVLHSGLPTPC